MVGRLVEDEHVLGARHEPREGGTGPLAAAQQAQFLFLRFAAEQERAREVPRRLLAEELIGAFVADDLLEIADDGELGIERFVALLEVPDRELGAQRDAARVGVGLAQQAAHERGLPRPVGAQDAPTLAPLDREIQIIEQHACRAVLVGIRLFEPAHVRDDVACPLGLGQLEPHRCRVQRLLDRQRGLLSFEPALAPACLLGALPRLVLADEGFFLLELGLLGLPRAPLDLEPLGPQLPERLVIAGILDQPSALRGDGLDLDDPADDRVEQVAVVADHQYRAAVLVLEEALEPDPALDIQVVGRLVEQQDVGLGEQDLREREPRALPSRQPFDGDRELGIGEPQAVQDGVDPVRVVQPAPGVDLFLDLGLSAEEFLQFVTVRLAHRLEDIVQLVLQFLDVPERGGRLLAERLAGLEPVLLGEVRRLRPGLQHDLPAVGFQVPREHLEQAGLAAPVAAHHAHTLPGLDGERDRVEDAAVAVGEFDVGGGEDGHAGRG